MVQRIDNDFYETPPALTERLITFLASTGSLLPHHNVLECCSGDGSISNVLNDLGYRTTTNDYDPFRSADYHYNVSNALGNALLYHESQIKQDWVITNPPYSVASKVVRETLQYTRLGGAYLLRLTFLEPTNDKRNGRRDLLVARQDQLRYVIPVNPRPQFRPDTRGTDSVTVAWFVWDKQWSWERQGIVSPFQFFITDWR